MSRPCSGGLRVVVVVALAAGCSGDERDSSAAVAGQGDERAGRRVAIEHGCGSCHRIPGLPHDALVGPPLDAWGRRSFIAGTLPNNAENLRIWLEDPQQVRPGSAMPDLGLSDSEIADLVAYLFSLD